MEPSSNTSPQSSAHRIESLRIGDWTVNTATGQIQRSPGTNQGTNYGATQETLHESIRLEARALRLLLSLAERPGQVVSIDDLLTVVWPDVTVSPDSVYQAVASLRRQLGDDPRQPTYIATVPRLGYQMVAPVSPLADSRPDPATNTAPDHASGSTSPKIQSGSTQSQPVAQSVPTPAPRSSSFHPRRKALVPAAIAASLCIVLVAGFLLHTRAAIEDRAQQRAASAAAAAQPRPSIAVLPFLDLTQGMKQEEFADGMTEELIDRLAKVPGLRVPPPTSSFVYKGKQVPVADIARALGVAYVLDGSVRKDGTWVRIATRLVRADSGYVLWSETYDRPFHDILAIQDDIATAATKALTQSIALGANQNPSQ